MYYYGKGLVLHTGLVGYIVNRNDLELPFLSKEVRFHNGIKTFLGSKW